MPKSESQSDSMPEMTGKLTKTQSKFVNSLKQKKYRDANRCFVVEGTKMVEEAVKAGAKIELCTYSGVSTDFSFRLPVKSLQTSERELQQMSAFKTANRILAVCSQMTDSEPIDWSKPVVALDGVSDPGNLGTIFRMCDWFGIDQLICGSGTVDQYNPKVVQATMGSIFRVKTHYGDLPEILSDRPSGHPVFYADMGGGSIYELDFPPVFTLVMGSESHGVSEAIRSLDAKSIAIPQFGSGESLNVAVSASIITAEFRRQHPVIGQ